MKPYHIEHIFTLSQWFLDTLHLKPIPGLPNWHPRFGLTEYSTATDFGLGLLVFILIMMTIIVGSNEHSQQIV